MRPRRDAHRPRSSNIVIDRPQHQVAVEYLNAPVAPIRNIDIAFGVGRDRMRRIEFVRLISESPNGLDESPFLSYLATRELP